MDYLVTRNVDRVLYLLDQHLGISFALTASHHVEDQLVNGQADRQSEENPCANCHVEGVTATSVDHIVKGPDGFGIAMISGNGDNALCVSASVRLASPLCASLRASGICENHPSSKICTEGISAIRKNMHAPDTIGRSCRHGPGALHPLHVC